LSLSAMRDADLLREACLNPTIPPVARSGWTLLYPPGDSAQWDGLLAWFRQAVGKYQPLVEQHSLLRRWVRVL
jgi:hypothetical protein